MYITERIKGHRFVCRTQEEISNKRIYVPIQVEGCILPLIVELIHGHNFRLCTRIWEIKHISYMATAAFACIVTLSFISSREEARCTSDSVIDDLSISLCWFCLFFFWINWLASVNLPPTRVLPQVS